MNKIHVLIFEINLNGHHSIYLEKITESHLELGRIVTIVFSEKFKEDILINKLKQLYANSLNIILLNEIDCEKLMKSRWGNIGREFGLWYLFKKTFNYVESIQKIDFIFLPYADYCLNAIGLLGSPFRKITWSGICMRPAFHYQASGVIAPTSLLLGLKRVLFNLVLKNKKLSCLFTIDELLINFIKKHNFNLTHRLSYLADPADPPLNFNNSILRQRYKININVNVILVYGAIDDRKNLFELLTALSIDKNLIEWHVLIVGKQSNSVRTELTNIRWDNLKIQNRIYIIDEFVKDEVEQHVFSMCDVVWIAYLGHYQMSGVLVKSGLYRKPVISCEEGLIGWYTKQYKVGVTIIPNTINNVNIAINELKTSNNIKKFGENGFQLFKNNTWNNFIKNLKNTID